MWPFRKRKETTEPSGHEHAVERLKAFRGVGETFNYLGRTCVVTGHVELLPYVGIVPMLRYNYADDLGKLHSMSAMVSELPALIAQQEETP